MVVTILEGTWQLDKHMFKSRSHLLFEHRFNMFSDKLWCQVSATAKGPLLSLGSYIFIAQCSSALINLFS